MANFIPSAPRAAELIRKFEDLSVRNTANDYWNCTVCTLMNPSNLAKCQVCDSSSSHKTENDKKAYSNFLVDDTQESQWSCSQCTFKNNQDFLVCSICQSPKLNDSQNWPTTTKRTPSSDQTSIGSGTTGISPFLDESFPPNPTSLYFNPNASSSSNPNRSVVCQWLRPKDIFVEEMPLNIPWTVVRTPLPSDIYQGILGNCWFLSALSVVCERNDLVDKILLTKEISQEGLYLIRLYNNGLAVNVIVDDFLPCDKHKRLVYAQSRRKQLWVCLIEKAMAKIHGCYEALTSGRTIEGLSALTGFPCESITLQDGFELEEKIDRDFLWARLLSCNSAKFLMGASCGAQNIPKWEFEQKGLTQNHAYSILNLDDSSSFRLVQLRNPWGRKSWNGEWADNSSKWNQFLHLKNKLMPYGDADGIFWISFDDFLRYFEAVDICRVRDNWHETRIEGLFPPPSESRSPVILLTVLEPTEIDVTLYQEVQRNSRNSTFTNDSLIDLSILLFRGFQKNDKTNTVGIGQFISCSTRRVRSCISFSNVLEPGIYFVIPLALNNNLYPLFRMSIYSSRQILSEQVTLGPQDLSTAMIQFAKKKGDLWEDCGIRTYTMTTGWSGLLVLVENSNHNKWVQVNCDCDESYNVVSTRGKLNTVDVIPPRFIQLVQILTQLEEGAGFGTSYRLKYKTGVSSDPKQTNHHPPLERDSWHTPRPI